MGTQPTNAGIDFQQRVSGWILFNMVMDMDLANSIDIKENTYIEKVAFETRDIIDDLVVTTKDNKKLFFQMKRTASLTKSEDSDFYKAINQFVKQYIQEDKSLNNYILVTTSNTSNPIKNDLRKILESIRLNPLSFIENPLNKGEKSVFDRFKNLIREIYKKVTDEEMSDQQFLDFSSKMIISILDIEDGMTFEKSVLIALSSKLNTVSPQFFWSFLISTSLSFASSRMSVLCKELKDKWKEYIDIPKENVSSNDVVEGMFKFILNEDDFSLGRDVILAEGNEELGDGFSSKMLLMELYRFDEDGSKRIQYIDNNYVNLKNGIRMKVLHRTATNAGMERYLMENDENLPYDELIIAPAKGIESIEQELPVKLHKELCQKYIKDNKNKFMNCLHCGKGISEKSYAIEIDDLYEKSILGVVHHDCLRPIDRVLGFITSDTFEKYDYLKKFDYNLWVNSIKDSQALLNNLKNSKVPQLAYMAWNPYRGSNSHFNNCIKINLSNGDFRYILERGKVDRFNKSEAKKKAKIFNERFEKNKDSDPIGYTSVNYIYGTYSYLVKIKNDNEDILECVSAEVEKYNNHIGIQYSNNKNYYAPLLTITLLENEELLTLNGCLVFLSDPMTLNKYLSNWEKAGLNIKEYELNILSTDEEFDNLMRAYDREDIKGVIDPILDIRGEFSQGVVLENINKLQRIRK
ncbi:hypothetical protein [Bacillus cereus]|uniref:hypothetical protein n=3 Tax=Bacillus cereus TaxID=1396 RepID=UPI000BECBD45|nr:hypothetical protein [Bacillus cereus]MEB8796656.1 hypothetical protein [Bacillus cereus]MEB8992819.1 hypothetical protein [Bacillus cereus]MEB9183955.1 hypothetical protein [Bacillus cereus]PDY57532.1 hypothetical protein COM88_30755 [Bacillus cereus]